MDRQRADNQVVAVDAYTAQARHGAEIDQGLRRLQPQLHRRNQTMAAGEQFAVLAVLGHQLQRFFDRARRDIAEISGKHGQPPFGSRHEA